MLRDLRHPDGGFFSAEDADSEGIEGKFYLWSLERDRGARRRRRRRGHPLLRRDRRRQLRGPAHRLPRQHPARRRPRRKTAPTPSRARVTCSSTARAQRVRPGLDDKVLLGWNALFLRTLAEAAAAFARDDWMDAARDERALPARADAARRRPAPAVVAGRPRRAPRLRRGLRRAARSAAHAGRGRRRRVAGATRATSPTSSSGSSPTTSTAGSSRPAPTPRR